MSSRVHPLPPPKAGTAPPTWPAVVADLRAMAKEASPEDAAVWRALAEDAVRRDAMGAQKYGVRHHHGNGRPHHVDGLQEALDGMGYWGAEYLATGTDEAAALYASAVEHAFRCMRYVLKKDGR